MSAARWFRGFFANIQDGFLSNPALHIFDILIFTVLLYLLFAFLKKNNATKLIFIFLPLFFAAVILSSSAAGFPILGRVLIYFLIIVGLGIAILFPQQIRRGLFRLSASKEARESFSTSYNISDEELTEVVENIVKACQNLAKKNIGALIVIMPEGLPEHILESGTHLDAHVTAALLESIFTKNSPLHDGAVCIRGNKIVAAGCFLPLSHDLVIDKDLGTRHRAAIGVTEGYRAFSIVVSEESGVISTANVGLLTRYFDSEKLLDILMQVYGLKVASSEKREDKVKRRKK